MLGDNFLLFPPNFNRTFCKKTVKILIRIMQCLIRVCTVCLCPIKRMQGFGWKMHVSSDFIWHFRKLPFPSHLGKYFIKIGKICFVCLFCCFTSQVNSYGHCGTVSSPNHTFSWAGLNKRLTSNSCTYFRL